MFSFFSLTRCFISSPPVFPSLFLSSKTDVRFVTLSGDQYTGAGTGSGATRGHRVRTPFSSFVMSCNRKVVIAKGSWPLKSYLFVCIGQHMINRFVGESIFSPSSNDRIFLRHSKFCSKKKKNCSEAKGTTSLLTLAISWIRNGFGGSQCSDGWPSKQRSLIDCL